MAPPIVDTFEHDIADEIRHKEASITDIAGAVGDIGNNPKDETPSNASTILLYVVLALVLCAIIGVIAMAYLYFTGKYDPFAPPQNTTPAIKKVEGKGGVSLSSLFPSLETAFGIHVTAIERTSAGYNITISSYSPVFSYMIKNESVFKEELGMSVNSRQQPKKVTSPPAATTEPVATSTTLVATSTTGTSTEVTSTSTEEVASFPLDAGGFVDVTVDNQNMRVGESLFGTVVYAFIGTKNLVISSSTGGVLLMRNNILHK